MITIARIAVLLICCGFLTKGYSQLTSKRINHRLYVLKSQGVDTIVCYSHYCKGDTITPVDSCTLNETHYLFWSLYGRHYMQKIDACKSYPVVSLERSDLLTMAIDSLQSVKIATILPVIHIEKNKNGQDVLQKAAPAADGTCYTDFEFFISKEQFRKQIDHFLMDTKTFSRDKVSNSNYSVNQQSILKHLRDFAEKETRILR